jgi:hypothetical protein
MHDESSNHRNIRTRPGGRQIELASRPMRLLRPKYHRITGRPLCRSGACSLEDLYKLPLHPELDRVCSSQYRLHIESATSTSPRLQDLEQSKDGHWCRRISQEPSVCLQAGRGRSPQDTILSVARRCSNYQITLLTAVIVRRSSRSGLASRSGSTRKLQDVDSIESLECRTRSTVPRPLSACTLRKRDLPARSPRCTLGSVYS